VRYFVYSRYIPGVEIVPRTADPAGFQAASPLGKVPALVTDTGAFLFESEAINEYLAELCKPPVFVPMLPTDPDERALSRAVSRVVDIHIGANMPVLWTKVDDAARAKAIAEIHKALDAIEGKITGPLVTSHKKPVLADAALATTLIHVTIFGSRYGLKPFENRPKLTLFNETMLKVLCAFAYLFVYFSFFFFSLQDPDFKKVHQEVHGEIERARQAAKAAQAKAQAKL